MLPNNKTIVIDHLPSRTIHINNTEYLFFSGTSYLGMGHQPLFKEALLEGIQKYGTIFSASRNNNLQLEIYEQAENYLAQWTGAESALTVTSGLLAGQLAVHAVSNHSFIYAPSVHPALWREKPSPSFNDYDHFKNDVHNIVNGVQREPVVICSNTIDPLKCTPYDFSWIKNLPNKSSITLIFDDSHAIGIMGTEGGGHFKVLRELAPSHVKVIVIASLAKAMGLPGGVILGDKDTIQSIRSNPLFVGASPMIPAYLYAFLKSQNVYQRARTELLKNINLFKTLGSKHLHLFKYYDNYPVFYTEQVYLMDKLLKSKILISSFSYPNPNDPPITRIILSALHTEEDIEYLCRQLAF